MEFFLPTINQLTPQMKNLVNFGLNQYLLVVGAPGTGKSVIAIHRFQHLKSQGKKVLLLCYNVLLNKLLKDFCEERECRTLDSFYGHITYINNGNQKTNSPMIGDEIIIKIQEQLTTYKQNHGKFDAILIDEAQDLPIHILESMSILTDHLSLFADPNQPLKNPSSDIGVIEYAFQNMHKEILTRNYRNTKQIYEFAAQKFMSGNELANNPSLTTNAPNDTESTPIIKQGIGDINEQLNEINAIINTYTNLSIGIFVEEKSKVNTVYTYLIGKHANVTRYHSDARDVDTKQNILITTYTSAKGLEFDVAILIIDGEIKENTNQKLYVLSTRAKKRLYYLFAK